MLSLWPAKPQSLSSQSYCSASEPSSCICGFSLYFLWSVCFFYVPDYKSNICPLWKVCNERKITKGRKRASYKSAWMVWIHLHKMFLYVYKVRQRSTGIKRERGWKGCLKRCSLKWSQWLHSRDFYMLPYIFFLYALWIFKRTNLYYLFKTNFL